MRHLASATLLSAALIAVLVQHDTISERFSPRTSLLERIVTNGTLYAGTRLSPVSYLPDRDRFEGFEYELLRLFSDSLGVALELHVPDSPGTLIDDVADARLHLDAAGLTKTRDRARRVDFGPVYQSVTPRLVYRKPTPNPTSLSRIWPGELVVVAGSSHAERLRQLHHLVPQLSWEARHGVTELELIEAVQRGAVRYTIADSTTLSLLGNHYPDVQSAFDIGPPEPVAWALPKTRDKSLLTAVEVFFLRLRHSGELTALRQAHLAADPPIDYVDLHTFYSLLESRLPPLLQEFRAAGARFDIDWRLLAAMAYQESHWNPQAVSPTGVQGLMMLTRPTARDLDVNDRLDPWESLDGGARYLRRLSRRLPETIPESEQIWFALAAYNIGLGHLEDARVLTERLGGDPSQWDDVRKHLPLLRERLYHEQSRNGYARGDEAAQYVENIRSYYALLVDLSNSGFLRRLERAWAADEEPTA